MSLKKQEPLKNELIDFLDAIGKKRNPLVTGDDGVEAIRIATAALSSIKERKLVEMAGFLAG